jgi:hypothetical protein
VLGDDITRDDVALSRSAADAPEIEAAVIIKDRADAVPSGFSQITLVDYVAPRLDAELSPPEPRKSQPSPWEVPKPAVLR